MDSKKILLISSLPPSHSAGLGEDIMDALTRYGYEVDMLIKYPYRGQKRNITNVLTYTKREKLWDWYIRPILRKSKLLRWAKRFVKSVLGSSENYKSSPYKCANGIIFIYPDENMSQVDPEMVVSKIHDNYDAVLTLFWQDFITSKTIKAIYDKLECPILIYSVDMAPITGGCFYFSNCRRFETQCGKCPAINSNDPSDVSHKNYLIKKENYAKSNSFYLGNTWMNEFAKKSGIFQEDKIIYSSIVINDNKFSPAISNKDKFRIPGNKQFVILLRSCVDEARKGFNYAVRILSDLYTSVSSEERDKILIITIGNRLDRKHKEQLKFETLVLGKVNTRDLIKAYRTASIFLSTSIDDAGPSMVNQAMMCGTPVASFKIGTAIDLIQNDVSGIIAPLKDTQMITDGILRLIRNPHLLIPMSEHARNSAIRHNSPSSFAERIGYLLN